MRELEPGKIREHVRKRYGSIAQRGPSGCGCKPSSCCSAPSAGSYDVSTSVGYSGQEEQLAPQGSNLGLGCGNPHAIAGLQPGDTVLDLGCGAGFDSFLAAKQVGSTGHVIGVDMTPEMVAKARDLAKPDEYPNVEFRLGEIENLPVRDASIDVIMSNCVINLSPDKRRVFREAFRALRPGGRMAVSDVVAIAPMPEDVRNDLDLYSSCISGAISATELETILIECGFQEIRIQRKGLGGVGEWVPGLRITDLVDSATIEAVKPVQ